MLLNNIDLSFDYKTEEQELIKEDNTHYYIGISAFIIIIFIAIYLYYKKKSLNNKINPKVNNDEDLNLINNEGIHHNEAVRLEKPNRIHTNNEEIYIDNNRVFVDVGSVEDKFKIKISLFNARTNSELNTHELTYDQYQCLFDEVELYKTIKTVYTKI